MSPRVKKKQNLGKQKIKKIWPSQQKSLKLLIKAKEKQTEIVKTTNPRGRARSARPLGAPPKAALCFSNCDVNFCRNLIDFWPVPMRRPFGQRWIFLKKGPHGCGLKTLRKNVGGHLSPAGDYNDFREGSVDQEK